MPALDSNPSSGGVTDLVNAVPAAPDDHSPISVVFIDGRLNDVDQIEQGLPPGAEVVILDETQDGFAQMATYLSGRHGIDSIALISHGTKGAVQAGTAWLASDTLSQHAEALKAIGASLSESGDLLLYGCKVAEGSAGQQLLNQIAAITSADVAGSTDNTGAAALGGNWSLEQSTGAIEVQRLAGTMARYGSLLAAPTYETFDGLTLPDDGGRHLILAPAQDLTFNGWTFGMRDYAGNADSGSQLVGTNQRIDTSLSDDNIDKALILLGSSSSYAGVIKSTNGEEFKLNSIRVEDYASGNLNYRLVGYRDGVQVSSAVLNFTMADYGTTVNGQQVSVSGAQWQYIDEVRIVYQNGSGGVSFALDDIDVSVGVPPNVPPVIGNLNGDSVTFVEKSGGVLVDAGANVTITDGDSTDFNGGNLTVDIITNRSPSSDVLSIQNQGTGAGQIGVSGSTVTYGGVAIGTFSGGTGSSQLIITFNANANATSTRALIDAVRFDNTSSDPSSSPRTLSFTVNDGDSSSNSATVTTTVNIVKVNDAPTLTVTTATPTLTENGAAVTLFSGATASAIESADALRTLTLTVNNVSDGASEVLNIDGSQVLLTHGTVVASTATNGFSATVSVSGGVATVTLDKSAGVSATTLQTLVNGITYRNLSDNPTAGSRNVTLTSLRDTGGVANGGVDTTALALASTVTVVAVNDAPVLTTSGGSAAFVAGDNAPSTPVAIDSALTVSDVDNLTLNSATVTIGSGFSAGQDQLNFVANPGAYGNITASYNASTGVMTLSSVGSTATTAQWQAALRSITYSNSAVTPNSATRTIAFVVSDGTDSSTSSTKTVTVTPVDQTPIVSAGAGMATFTEGDSPTAVAPALTVSDLDNSTLASATVQISDNFRTGEDVLGFTNSNATLYGNIVGSYNASTGVLTLQSAGFTATVAQWQAALRSVYYSNTSHSPDTASRTISFHVSDGVKSSAAVTKTMDITAVNDSPVVANPIADQTASEDAAFSFQIPANAITDVDTGDTLTFSAQLSGGGALPAWLSFNPLTRTFSGTPGNADVGTSVIEVTASDGNGGLVTDTFQLTVNNTNDAPVLTAPLANQSATEDAAFQFQIPANTFADVDVGGTLAYSTQLSGGAALPAWLNFDAATRTFSGTPTNADVGSLTIDVIASDGNGGSVTGTFNLTVANTNDVPVVVNPVPAQAATEDVLFSFQVPSNTFADVDVGDTLIYSARLSGGAALPSWLSFDPSTRTFSGTPSNSSVGTLSITLSASDGKGGVASNIFDITVANTHDAPALTAPISDQSAYAESIFSYRVAANAFTDVDFGDVLTYSASLSSGSALPSWLSFDSTTRTFSGTPATADMGLLDIQVVVTDSLGATAIDVFRLVVSGRVPPPLRHPPLAHLQTQSPHLRPLRQWWTASPWSPPPARAAPPSSPSPSWSPPARTTPTPPTPHWPTSPWSARPMAAPSCK